MRRILISALLAILLLPVSFGQNIDIGLFHDEVVSSLVVYCTGGEYLVKASEEPVAEFSRGDILFISLEDNSLSMHDDSMEYGKFRSIEIEALTLDGTFRVRPINPALESRSYDDHLFLRPNHEFIYIINRVDMDKYIAGVLETEVGPNANKELYKAHALLTRTYLLQNFERHIEEEYSLCDGVHCQAYKGRSIYNPEIQEAVFETSGEVVTDFHYKLITAAYHANSGGETQRAADVWLKDVDYLQAVIDPHSLHQPQAKWYDTIFFDDWKKYLLDNEMESVKKIPDELLYVQQRHRKKYFVLDQDSILMTRIREDWNLRSTFFNMFPEIGGRIVIWGKGYGHGVGLSQEGAMKMADLGYSYKDIIRFYFFNIRIMHYEDLPVSSLPKSFLAEE